MQYINPFELLNLTADNLATVDSVAVSKAKRKLLAEIELSDNNSIRHNGYELTKADCLRAIDDLDNRDKKEFHYFIYQDKHFNKFLSSGTLSFFDNYKAESIYKLPEFLDFISPFFCEQYDKILSEYYKKGNAEAVSKILSVKPITNEAYQEKCYKRTYAFLRTINGNIEKIKKDIESYEKNGYSNFAIGQKFNGLVQEISGEVNVQLLNILPSYFQQIRNQLAQTIRNLARDINNEPYFLYEPAFKIIEIANSISTDGLVKQTITKGYYTIKQNYDDDLKKAEEEKQAQQYSDEFTHYRNFTNQLDKISEDIDNKSSAYIQKNFSGLYEWITVSIDISDLNALPELFNTVRRRIAIQLKHLSVSIWNDHEKIEPAFKLIQLATEIKISDEETKERISKDYETLKAIDERKKKYGKPIASTPSMSTINGIGTKIYDDTLYFVFLFIPIFPIARYSLEYDGYKSYRFFGKLELHQWQKIWQWAIAGGAVLLIIIAIINSNSSSSSYRSSNYSSPSYNSENYSQPSNSYSSPSTNNYSSNDIPPPPKPTYKLISMKNGNITGCKKIKAKYDYTLDNKLMISAGNNADVAVKLYNLATDKCIRFVFIQRNTTYSIKNIPQGKYYLKIAYGDDWGIEEGESSCNGRFTSNVLYKKSDEVLDFNLVETYDGWKVPSFSLELNVVYTSGDMNQFSTNAISSSDFNNE